MPSPDDDDKTRSEQERAEIEAAWEQEVLRIARAHDEGRAGSVPWETARAEVLGERE